MLTCRKTTAIATVRRRCPTATSTGTQITATRWTTTSPARIPTGLAADPARCPGRPGLPGAPGLPRAGPPPAGLLDLTLSWGTFTGAAPGPGLLGRIGPIAAVQARQLADLAQRGGQAEWRVLLIGRDGRCLAVARVP